MNFPVARPTRLRDFQPGAEPAQTRGAAPSAANDVLGIGERRAPSLKRRALHLAQRVLYRSGIALAYATVARPTRATILMYHAVARAEEEPWIAPGNRVSAETFERHCRYLARHRSVLSLDDFLDRLETGRSIPARAVVLTFDDGYLDTLEVAAPILARYGLPATLYLATGYVDRGKNQWEDELYAAYRHAARLPDDVFQSYRAEAAQLLRSDMETRERELDSIRARLRPTQSPPRTTLTWDEVRELDRAFPQIALGVHTDEHVNLAALSTERARAHVMSSIDRFEQELGRRPAHFAFPYSRVNEDVRRELPRLGLRSAMTTTGVVNTTRSESAWDLQRLEAQKSLETIGYWTSGAHPDLSERLFGRA